MAWSSTISWKFRYWYIFYVLSLLGLLLAIVLDAHIAVQFPSELVLRLLSFIFVCLHEGHNWTRIWYGILTWKLFRFPVLCWWDGYVRKLIFGIDVWKNIASMLVTQLCSSSTVWSDCSVGAWNPLKESLKSLKAIHARSYFICFNAI